MRVEVTSGCPKVSTRSLKVPMMVNGSPLSFSHSAHRFVGRSVKLLGKFLGDHANLVVRLLVLGVEEPARKDHQVAHDAVVRQHPQHADVAFLAVPNRQRSSDGTTGDAAAIPGTVATPRACRRW